MSGVSLSNISYNEKIILRLQIMVLEGSTVVLMWCQRIPLELVVRTCGGKTFAPA